MAIHGPGSHAGPPCDLTERHPQPLLLEGGSGRLEHQRTVAAGIRA
ncbi:hypothetical protein [Streptomyces gilvosporeus]|nr:hypothetical protein [Streptomyces gilvosporeus]